MLTVLQDESDRASVVPAEARKIGSAGEENLGRERPNGC